MALGKWRERRAIFLETALYDLQMDLQIEDVRRRFEGDIDEPTRAAIAFRALVGPNGPLITVHRRAVRGSKFGVRSVAGDFGWGGRWRFGRGQGFEAPGLVLEEPKTHVSRLFSMNRPPGNPPIPPSEPETPATHDPEAPSNAAAACDSPELRALNSEPVSSNSEPRTPNQQPRTPNRQPPLFHSLSPLRKLFS